MGVAVEYGWLCMDCGEQANGERADKDAEKHGKATGHSTRSWAVPATVTPPDHDKREG